jgi:hypothetical protein
VGQDKEALSGEGEHVMFTELVDKPGH